jgi:hypothetical protein
VGVATGVPVQFISVGESFQDGDLEGFLDIVNFIAAETTPPYVLTTSYGQDESTISRALATYVVSCLTCACFLTTHRIYTVNSATPTPRLVLEVFPSSSLAAMAVCPALSLNLAPSLSLPSRLAAPSKSCVL